MNKILLRILNKIEEVERRKRISSYVSNQLSRDDLSSLELLELIRPSHPETIYDIGANRGKWSLLARAIFPDANIEAFEPIPEMADLHEKQFLNDPKCHIHRIALGNISQPSTFTITSFPDASSFLKPTDQLKRDFDIVKKSEITVDQFQLDEYVSKNSLPYPDAIKLDVQGYEIEVLKGASQCLEKAKHMILEVSFVRHYENQAMFPDVISFMAQHGFGVYAFQKGMPTGKRILQADVLFKSNVD
jgi:FkbM family methyltransferase